MKRNVKSKEIDLECDESVTVEEFNWNRFYLIDIKEDYATGLYEYDYIEVPLEDYYEAQKD
jgi:hypothetical protein